MQVVGKKDKFLFFAVTSNKDVCQKRKALVFTVSLKKFRAKFS